MYRTTFQCPDSGQTIIATYHFGRVRMEAVDPDEFGIFPETTNYIKRYNNHRCLNLVAANEFIIEVSGGQTYGFEN